MADEQRRAFLSAFLVRHRAALRPADVGLPETARRRVPGLRREEVAELIGVTPEWYRWFESGRNVQLSQPLVARLAGVLRLTSAQELELHILARPELFKAAAACGGVAPIPLAITDSSRSADDRIDVPIDALKLRRFVQHAGAARDWLQCVQRAADAAQEMIRPQLTVVALIDEPFEKSGYAVGPRGKYWTALHHEVARRLHFALDGGGIGSCERLLWSDELPPKRSAVNVFRRLQHDPTTYLHTCDLAVWAEFNARVTARSALIVPLFADQRFRGVMSLGWSEPREMKPAEVETLSTIGGVVALVER